MAYLAPEQTGRSGRSVDQRADLYAFGATLYELATGAPPFGSDDPLRITHDHLARAAVPPAEENPAVLGALSEIIMHLLEKEPDSRYQTADGVAYDLERLRDGAAAGPVHVGKRDFPHRLLPPSRLVGSTADELSARLAVEATRAIVELRELARGIHPVALAKGGLGPAVKGLARRSATAVRGSTGACPSRSRSPPTTSSPRRSPTQPNMRTPRLSRSPSRSTPVPRRPSCASG